MRLLSTFLFFLLALALTFSTSAAVKGADVGGVIKDSHNKAIDFVSVYLIRNHDSTTVKTVMSDGSGAFSFKDVPRGKYHIVLSQIGMKKYKTSQITVKDEKDNISLGTIVMEAESRSLNAVTVTAQKPLIERKGDRLIVNVASSTVSTGATALEVLQRAPGVSLDKDDNISLRGKQGVLVMIDGKPTYMSTADLTNMLRNMQSNEIEALEIITNPSARYEAEGKSGIINIRLKKNRNFGTNGTLTAGAAYSGYRKFNGGISLNNRSKHFNVFGNYNYGDSKGQQITEIDRINDYQGVKSLFSQSADNARFRRNNNFKVGADWYIDKVSTVGVQLNGYFNNSDDDIVNNTYIGPQGGRVDSTVNSFNDGSSKYRNTSINLNYRGKLDSAGRELSIDLDYASNFSDDQTYYNNNYSYSTGKPAAFERLRAFTPSHIDIYAIKADYVHPFGKAMKMEVGYKSSWVKTDNDFQFAGYVNDNWANDARRSNHFVYRENINALYLNMRMEWKKWNVQAGLRAEQTNSRGDMLTTNTTFKRHYLDFFPSTALNYEANASSSFGFSYSRRITRPGYDALNPFEYFLDRYTFNRGNPYLRPEYTNTFDLSYTLLKKYIVSLNYSHTKDGITEVLLPDPEKSSLFQTNANLAEQYNYSLNITVPLTLAKWWSGNTNINLFRSQFKTPDLNGQALNTDQTTLQVYSSQNFTLTKNTSLELTGNYQSKAVYGTLVIRPQYALDFGASQSFANKRLSVKLAVVDIFRTRYGRISSSYPGLDFKLFQRTDSRMVRLTLAYKFGSNEIKPARTRATGLDAEAGRVKK